MTTSATVFIVDDDPAARDSVAALVRSRQFLCRTFASAEEFLAANVKQPDACIVLDIRMTGLSGMDVLERLRTAGNTIPVIMITGYGDIPTAVRAMRLGAYAFLEKPCQNTELFETIQSAIHWSTSRASELERIADIRNRVDSLTADELRVLKAIMIGKSNKSIAQEMEIGLRTVELRRATIFKKLGVESLALAVRYALLAGIEGSADLPALQPAALCHKP